MTSKGASALLEAMRASSSGLVVDLILHRSTRVSDELMEQLRHLTWGKSELRCSGNVMQQSLQLLGETFTGASSRMAVKLAACRLSLRCLSVPRLCAVLEDLLLELSASESRSVVALLQARGALPARLSTAGSDAVSHLLAKAAASVLARMAQPSQSPGGALGAPAKQAWLAVHASELGEVMSTFAGVAARRACDAAIDDSPSPALTLALECAGGCVVRTSAAHAAAVSRTLRNLLSACGASPAATELHIELADLDAESVACALELDAPPRATQAARPRARTPLEELARATAAANFLDARRLGVLARALARVAAGVYPPLAVDTVCELQACLEMLVASQPDELCELAAERALSVLRSSGSDEATRGAVRRACCSFEWQYVFVCTLRAIVTSRTWSALLHVIEAVLDGKAALEGLCMSRVILALLAAVTNCKAVADERTLVCAAACVSHVVDHVPEAEADDYGGEVFCAVEALSHAASSPGTLAAVSRAVVRAMSLPTYSPAATWALKNARARLLGRARTVAGMAALVCARTRANGIAGTETAALDERQWIIVAAELRGDAGAPSERAGELLRTAASLIVRARLPQRRGATHSSMQQAVTALLECAVRNRQHVSSDAIELVEEAVAHAKPATGGRAAKWARLVRGLGDGGVQLRRAADAKRAAPSLADSAAKRRARMS
jgi:hypothetical protein